MNKSEAKSRIEALTVELRQAEHAYRQLDAPIMTDERYDTLMRELQQLEADFPELQDPSSPSSRVGSPVQSEFKKVRHPQPMLSLDNMFDEGELFAFFRKAAVAANQPLVLIAEPKIDGLAVRLNYKHGKLHLAATRGDHEFGADVTENVKTIRSVPLDLGYDIDIEVRGEVCMTRSVFEALNVELAEAGEETFSNARNAASGSLKSKDSRECAARRLDFVAYGVLGMPADSHSDSMAYLDDLGFVTAKFGSMAFTQLLKKDTNEFSALIGSFLSTRDKLAYDTDGLVFKVDSFAAQKAIGEGSRAPKWACAFKYRAVPVTTQLLNIVYQVGKRGTITPVAELQPVECSGAIVSRASLCNANEIARLDLNIGDQVEIARRGEVIPKVERVVTKATSGSYQFPDKCPCCESPLVRRGVQHFCTADGTCRDQIVARLQHCLGKGALDWDGLGTRTIETLVDTLGCRRLSDVLALTDDQISRLFGASGQMQFRAERERIKTKLPLWRRILALGVDLIGSSASKQLARHYDSIVSLSEATVDQLTELLGPVAASNLAEALIKDTDELARLAALGYSLAGEIEPKPAASSTQNSQVAGKTFVLTGTMMTGTRGKISKLIEAHGGIVSGSVNRSTSFLVAGDGGGASKAAAAAKHNTPIITEEQLYALLGVAMPAPVADPELTEY